MDQGGEASALIVGCVAVYSCIFFIFHLKAYLRARHLARNVSPGVFETRK